MVLCACGGDVGTNPDGVSTNPGAATTFATFASIQQTVFTPTCPVSGCHNGSERPNLSNGVAYGSIVNVQSTRGIDYIDPGDPDGSYLYRKITGVNITGARMPRNRSALSSAVTDSINVWIENGALNN